MIRRPNVLRSLTGLATAFVVLLGATAPVMAATTNSASVTSGNGLRVSPVSTSVTINPGETKTLDVYVTNVTSQAGTFQAVVNDFVDSGKENGTPSLILNPGESAPTHSLRKFVTPLNDVKLAPGEQKDMKVVISIPKDASAGGYFGAVRFAATNEAQPGQNVALSASVASLILVKVPGDYKEQMSIESLDTRNNKGQIHSIFTKNTGINAVVRFKNSGDIQEEPFGKVRVSNMSGKVVYSAEINNAQQPGNVLPDSIRKFSIPVKNLSTFGKYTVQGDFGYGKGQTLTAKTTFYVIPVPVMIVLLVLVILLIVLIVELPRIFRRYNRRVLRRAGKK